MSTGGASSQPAWLGALTARGGARAERGAGIAVKVINHYGDEVLKVYEV